MNMVDQLAQALEDGLHYQHVQRKVLPKMRDAMAGMPKAQVYGSEGKAPVLYCETHEQDLSDCCDHDEGRPVPWGCTGVPVDVQTDPTGDAGAVDDPVRSEHREVQKRVARVARDMAWLRQHGDRWEGKPPTMKQRRETDSDNVRGCELHLRIGEWAERYATAEKGLERPVDLCSSCYRRYIVTDHTLPPTDHVALFHRTSKWPKDHAAPRNAQSVG